MTNPDSWLHIATHSQARMWDRDIPHGTRYMVHRTGLVPVPFGRLSEAKAWCRENAGVTRWKPKQTRQDGRYVRSEWWPA